MLSSAGAISSYSDVTWEVLADFLLLRAGMIAVFTVLFALTIAMLTNTRKQDIFVATAA